jgi:copper chaperone NosL
MNGQYVRGSQQTTNNKQGMSRMSPISRITAAVCSVLLVAVLFLPLWRIELSAPQYPEGLVLKIYPHKLGGDVEIVNGLNHYIGMRTLHAKDFVEFTVLPYIIGTLAFFGLASLLVNRKWFFITWTVFFLLFAVTAMIDFYRWEYNYGHNLDPTAPIQVPGMYYQPPLIGFKQLLNFGAYSIPDSGGWLFVVVALALVLATGLELRKKPQPRITKTLFVLCLLLACLFSSCSTDPQPIVFGTDACHYCKMTISDERFGAEVVSSKGKVYKFDDTQCLVQYLKENKINSGDLAGVFLVDFAGRGTLVNATTGILLESDSLHAPMGGRFAAFSHADSAQRYQQQLNGKMTTWYEISKQP